MSSPEHEFTEILNLISELERQLITLRSDVNSDDYRDSIHEKARTIKSKVDAIDIFTDALKGRCWKVLQLTGPSGFDPQPTLVECEKCGHFRLSEK